MQVNKQKNSKKSRLGHQTGPVPRKAAAGDRADRAGKGRSSQARIKAARSRFEERNMKDWSKPS